MYSQLKTPIEVKVYIEAPIEKVFKHIATAQGLDAWFTTGTRLEEFPDGNMELVWLGWGPDDVTTSSKCKVVKHEAPYRFTYQWWLDQPTTIEIVLSKVNNGTLLKLKESGYQNSDQGISRCLDCAVGWGEAITLLKIYCQHQISYK